MKKTYLHTYAILVGKKSCTPLINFFATLPRLMVKLHSFIKYGLSWRSGMVLEKLNVFNATARIRADKELK